MNSKKNKGQSLIEVIFSIGIVALVVTGVIVLLINVVGSRSRGFDRRKAAQLAEIKMESLVEQKRNDPVNFWKLNDEVKQPITGFDNYWCQVNYTNITQANEPSYTGCGIGTTDCTEVSVIISWSGKDDQSAEFKRFFTKKQ